MSKILHLLHIIKMLLIGSLLIWSIKLKASSYTTAVNGNWNNPGCWVNADIPAFNCSDTIIIKHHIVLPSNINLLNGAYLLIDSTGGLCGHFIIDVNAGASILKYGILEIDVLNQWGGSVNLLPPGNTIFTQYGLLTGGSFNNTSNLSVGPWFECQMPEYQFLNTLNKEKKEGVKLYPNPVTNTINLDFNLSFQSYNIFIFDIQGKLVFKNVYSAHQNLIDVSVLNNGLYFLQIVYNETSVLTKFIKQSSLSK